MEAQPRAAVPAGLTPSAYLGRLALGLAALWLLMGAWTLVADPYGLFRLVERPGFNQDKSDSDRLRQVLTLIGDEPAVMALGSSRAAAFDLPLAERFGGARTQAYSVPELRVREQAALLEYLAAHHPPRLLYLGVDFFAFGRGAAPPPHYARLDSLFWVDFALRQVISWDAFREGVRVVARSGDGAASGTGAEQEAPPVARFRNLVASFLEPKYYGGYQLDRAAFAVLGRAIGVLRQAGTEVVLFVGPTHALLLAAVRGSGAWPAYAEFHQRLATLADEQGVVLWDFSGVTAEGTEAVVADMLWYRDPSHYRAALARRALARMAGDASESLAGVQSTPANVAPRLEQAAADLTAWLAANPDSVALVEAAAAFVKLELAEPLLPSTTRP